MVTVVNNPQPTTEGGDNGMGALFAALMILIVVIVFIYFGLPALRSSNISPQINVPNKIDVNVNKTK